METRVILKYFVTDCVWKPFSSLELTTDPFKLNSFDNFGSFKVFHTILT